MQTSKQVNSFVVIKKRSETLKQEVTENESNKCKTNTRLNIGSKVVSRRQQRSKNCRIVGVKHGKTTKEKTAIRIKVGRLGKSLSSSRKQPGHERSGF
jgi:hypothetical protein